jgi:uncharacterized protein
MLPDNAKAPRSVNPLTHDQLQQLEELLAQTGQDEALSVEELDGFAAALACCPEKIPRTEWLAEVFGQPFATVKTSMPAKHLQVLTDLIEHHVASVESQLATAETFSPVINTDEQGRGLAYGWAIGFAVGMGLRPDAWDALEDEEDLEEVFVPIMDLVDEADEVGENPPEELTKEDCAERINAMLDGVFDAYQFFKVKSKGGDAVASNRAPGPRSRR